MYGYQVRDMGQVVYVSLGLFGLGLFLYIYNIFFNLFSINKSLKNSMIKGQIKKKKLKGRYVLHGLSLAAAIHLTDTHLCFSPSHRPLTFLPRLSPFIINSSLPSLSLPHSFHPLSFPSIPTSIIIIIIQISLLLSLPWSFDFSVIFSGRKGKERYPNTETQTVTERRLH